MCPFCRGDGAIVLDDDSGGSGGGAPESSNGSTAAATGKGEGGRSTGCSLAHASRCLHNVLYLCSSRAQVTYH